MAPGRHHMSAGQLRMRPGWRLYGLEDRVIGQSMNAMKSAAATVTLGAFGAFLGLAVAAGPAQAQSPFAGLTGSWSGNGKIVTTSGSERIRCRGTYRASE